jgi:hypothetical protein
MDFLQIPEQLKVFSIMPSTLNPVVTLTFQSAQNVPSIINSELGQDVKLSYPIVLLVTMVLFYFDAASH